MRDYLLDLVEHTYDLGCVDLIKIVGDDKTTEIHGLAEDLSVVLKGEFKNPVADFIGTFGMPNLGKLKTLLNLQEYQEGAKISVTKRSTGEPDNINFENASGDFKNSYRFMSAETVTAKLKPWKFNPPTWHIEFEPTVASVQKLKWQAQANAEEECFQLKTDGTDLKFYFGDHSTHAGNFVFQSDVSGQIKHTWAYPVSIFISIMNLVGNKRIYISDQGIAKITVDSGLAVYTYFLPAITK